MILKEIGDIKRFKEIITILSEEGFLTLLENIKVAKFIPLTKRTKQHLKSPPQVRLRKTLERLGPTFIKFGQLLSIRPDFVPKEYIKELEKLQSKVKPFPSARKVIEKQLGQKIEEVFKKFYDKPIASASMAQVHKAILNNGDVVAIKVKRPGITETLHKDFAIMKVLVSLLEKHVKAVQKYKPTKIVEEFSFWTKKELDFLVEMTNLKLFYDNFEKSTTTKIPKVYEEYCTDSLLVMEYLDGTELHNISKMKKVDVKKVMTNGISSILEQVFVHGLFHADPHPSNLLVMKDDTVGFVDFGIVGRFNEHLRDNSMDLFIGITEGDPEKVIDALLSLGTVDENINLDKFRDRVTEIILPVKDSSLQQLRISKVLEEVLDISLEFEVRIPREFVLFGKTLVTLEGIGLLYYPDFKFSEVVQPFIEEVMIERYNPENVLKKTWRRLFSYGKTLDKLPSQTARVLDKLEKGRIKIEMKDTDVKRLSQEIDKSSNRLAYGMIIAALIISGSLTITVSQGVIFGLPIISFISFVVAGIMGIFLLISILKEGKDL